MFSTRPSRPSLFHSAVFNELYYLADGGSVWLDVDPGESIPSTDLRYLQIEAAVVQNGDFMGDFNR
jgi:hypothetical protein